MLSDLIDIGVNLTGTQYRSDRDQVIERAIAAGVSRMVVTGTSESGSLAAADLAATRRGVLYSTAGVHPHNAAQCTGDTLTTLRELATRPEVVAIGECGLDYNRNFSPPAVQREWFAAQIELAVELGMPLFLHERDAADDFAAILGERRGELGQAVIHCFTGGRAVAERYLELALHIGVTGWICDERRGADLRDAVSAIPPDRLMIETDAPYLLPRDLVPRPTSRRNEPMYLPHICQVVADCAGRPAAQVAADTTRVARAFFGI